MRVPRHWPTGALQGVRARGGVTVDLAWKDGELTALSLDCVVPWRGRILHAERLLATDLPAGRTVILGE